MWLLYGGSCEEASASHSQSVSHFALPPEAATNSFSSSPTVRLDSSSQKQRRHAQPVSHNRSTEKIRENQRVLFSPLSLKVQLSTTAL